MGRAPCCDKANVKKGPWSPEEDAKLKAYIERYGTGGNWIALPQKIGLKRCGKSCRLRWLNYLRPNIKHGGFSEEEDNIICNLYISIGSRWSIIAAQLPGRTDNDIKNYWNTRLKKKLLGRRKQSNHNRLSSTNIDTNGVEESSSSSQGLSNSALERLQLHIQIQSMQNPLSFHNNPALWPKLHPTQEKLILQSLSERSNNPLLQHFQLPCLNQHLLAGNSIAFHQGYSKFEEVSKTDRQESSLNTITPSDSTSVPLINGNNNRMVQKTSDDAANQLGVQQVSAFQSEIEDLINNKISGFMGTQVVQNVPELDCFKEVDGSLKDNLIWWSNDFDHHLTKSASSSSWDSNFVLQSEGMFQDYELGYNM